MKTMFPLKLPSSLKKKGLIIRLQNMQLIWLFFLRWLWGRFIYKTEKKLDFYAYPISDDYEVVSTHESLSKMLEEYYNDALKTAEALFNGGSDANMPTSEIEESSLVNGEINIMDLLVLVNLLPSKGEARRLIQQGGLLVNDEKVTNIGLMISLDQLKEGVKIKKGKKVYHKVIVK